MVQIVKSIEEANCITHSGTMHADEVFATAFLDLLFGNVKVFRFVRERVQIIENNHSIQS